MSKISDLIPILLRMMKPDTKRKHEECSSESSSTDDNMRKSAKKSKKEKRNKKDRKHKKHKKDKKDRFSSNEINLEIPADEDAWLPKALQNLTQKRETNSGFISSIVNPLSTGVHGGGRDTSGKAGKGWSRTNALRGSASAPEFELADGSKLEQIVREESKSSKVDDSVDND